MQLHGSNACQASPADRQRAEGRSTTPAKHAGWWTQRKSLPVDALSAQCKNDDRLKERLLPTTPMPVINGLSTAQRAEQSPTRKSPLSPVKGIVFNMLQQWRQAQETTLNPINASTTMKIERQKIISADNLTTHSEYGDQLSDIPDLSQLVLFSNDTHTLSKDSNTQLHGSQESTYICIQPSLYDSCNDLHQQYSANQTPAAEAEKLVASLRFIRQQNRLRRKTVPRDEQVIETNSLSCITSSINPSNNDAFIPSHSSSLLTPSTNEYHTTLQRTVKNKTSLPQLSVNTNLISFTSTNNTNRCLVDSATSISTPPYLDGIDINQYTFTTKDNHTASPHNTAPAVNNTACIDHSFLYLQSSQLYTLPDATCIQYAHVTILDLSDNFLIVLPSYIGHMQRLTELRIRNNQLVELPTEMAKLCVLEFLDLGMNELQEIGSWIKSLQRLHHLDLRNNKLRVLPPELGCLEELTSLMVDDNPFDHVFRDLVQSLLLIPSLSLSPNDTFSSTFSDISDKKQVLIDNIHKRCSISQASDSGDSACMNEDCQPILLNTHYRPLPDSSSNVIFRRQSHTNIITDHKSITQHFHSHINYVNSTPARDIDIAQDRFLSKTECKELEYTRDSGVYSSHTSTLPRTHIGVDDRQMDNESPVTMMIPTLVLNSSAFKSQHSELESSQSRSGLFELETIHNVESISKCQSFVQSFSPSAIDFPKMTSYHQPHPGTNNSTSTLFPVTVQYGRQLNEIESSSPSTQRKPLHGNFLPPNNVLTADNQYEPPLSFSPKLLYGFSPISSSPTSSIPLSPSNRLRSTSWKPTSSATVNKLTSFFGKYVPNRTSEIRQDANTHTLRDILQYLRDMYDLMPRGSESETVLLHDRALGLRVTADGTYDIGVVNKGTGTSMDTECLTLKLSTNAGDTALVNEDTTQETKQRTRENRRLNVIDEIIVTEKTYIQQLECLIDIYLVPLKKSSVLTSEQTKFLFSNIQSILAFHKDYFLPELQANSNMIGGVFLRHSAYLKMYSVFINNYDKATTELDKWFQKRKKLRAFFETCKTHPRHSQLNLTSYLLLPVQRIPRYKMLLQDLLKYTESTHSDYGNLMKALADVGKRASEINEKKRDQENNDRMIAIQTKIRSKSMKGVNIMQPHRRLVREGMLHVVKFVQLVDCPSSILGATLKTLNVGNVFKFILFNDIIIQCKCLADRLLLWRVLPMSSKLSPASITNNGLLRVVDNNIILYLSSPQEQEILEWQRDINNRVTF